MDKLTRSLLQYIIFQLQEEQAPISAIRLIKLLYLIDLEYMAEHGRQLTNINWVFYRHGPYFFDWPDLIKSIRADISPEEIVTSSGYKGTTYSTEGEPILVNELKDFATKSLIDGILKKWEFEDTDELLKYVYATEPMQQAERGEALDLTFEHDLKAIQQARETATDIVTLEELFKEFGINDDG